MPTKFSARWRLSRRGSGTESAFNEMELAAARRADPLTGEAAQELLGLLTYPPRPDLALARERLLVQEVVQLNRLQPLRHPTRTTRCPPSAAVRCELQGLQGRTTP